jgi:intein/homing endonuclease
MISCVVCTARNNFPIIGLPDIHILQPTLYSLEKQTFRHFEVVIVDARFPEKREWIEKRKWSFPIKYIPPHPNHSFWLGRGLWNVAGMLNTALLYATGDLIVRIDDASEIPDINYLQKFWDAYQNGYFALAMHTRYRGGKQAYYNEEYRREGYEIAREPPSRKDILLNFFKEGDPVRDTRWPTVERHGRMVAPPEWFYGFSSFSLEAALKVNGFNELFDGCLPPDQLILGVETKPIEKIRVGDLVLTHKGRLRKVRFTFKRWFDGEVITFKLAGGDSITVTPEHPLLVRMPTPRGKRTVVGYELTLSEIKWVKAEEIYNRFCERNQFAHRRRKFRLVFVAPKSETSTKHVKLGRYVLKLNPDLARLIGYYISDGSASTRYLEFFFDKKQREYVDDALDLCNKELSFLKTKRKTDRHGSISKKGTLLRACFHVGREFAEEWKSWIGRNAREKRIPYEVLFNADENILKELKIGLWRGDGWENKYTTASMQLAYDVQLLLARLGVYSRVDHSIQKKGFGKGKDVYKVVIMNPRHRKHVKRVSHLTPVKEKEIRGNIFYRPIRSAKRSHYRGYVYNLEVEEDESYQVNAVCAHNCKGQEDQDFGIRLSMAGYKNIFLLDKDLWVIEHEHLPCVVKSPEPFKCNYGLIQYGQLKGLFRANSWCLSLEDCEWIRRNICPKCLNYSRCLKETLKGQFYVDNELFKLWLERQRTFDLREERLSV